MRLTLKRLSPMRGPDGDGYNSQVPARALQMQPDAAPALLQLYGDLAENLVLTDIYRSPLEILKAKQAKPSQTKGVGYSLHGFGNCFDADIDATLKRAQIGYADFSSICADHGYHSHRRDGSPNGSESWHFNFFGHNAARYLALADMHNHQTWDRPGEAWIQDAYGGDLVLAPDDVEAQLTAAGYDLGNGVVPCIKAFQRAWSLDEDGIAGPVTQRTLAFVTAEIAFV